MKKTFLSILFALAVLSLPVAAQADNVACYEWDCDSSTYICTFDASCTENDGMLWRYSWDFGDGTGTMLTGNPVIQHQFSSSYASSYVKLTVVDYDQDPFDETCEIVVDWQVGPPGPTSGICPE